MSYGNESRQGLVALSPGWGLPQSIFAPGDNIAGILTALAPISIVRVTALVTELLVGSYCEFALYRRITYDSDVGMLLMSPGVLLPGMAIGSLVYADVPLAWLSGEGTTRDINLLPGEQVLVLYGGDLTAGKAIFGIEYIPRAATPPNMMNVDTFF